MILRDVDEMRPVDRLWRVHELREIFQCFASCSGGARLDLDRIELALALPLQGPRQALAQSLRGKLLP